MDAWMTTKKRSANGWKRSRTRRSLSLNTTSQKIKSKRYLHYFHVFANCTSLLLSHVSNVSNDASFPIVRTLSVFICLCILFRKGSYGGLVSNLSLNNRTRRDVSLANFECGPLLKEIILYISHG